MFPGNALPPLSASRSTPQEAVQYRSEYRFAGVPIPVDATAPSVVGLDPARYTTTQIDGPAVKLPRSPLLEVENPYRPSATASEADSQCGQRVVALLHSHVV